jgi:hypothetical protein
MPKTSQKPIPLSPLLKNLAPGIEVSESHAKMMSKVMPYLMKCLKLWGFIKRIFAAMFSARGRIILAVVILFVAVSQHYLFSSGGK